MYSGYYWDDGEVKPFNLVHSQVPRYLMNVPIRFKSEFTDYYGCFSEMHGCWKRHVVSQEDMPKEFLTALLLLNIS